MSNFVTLTGIVSNVPRVTHSSKYGRRYLFLAVDVSSKQNMMEIIKCFAYDDLAEQIYLNCATGSLVQIFGSISTNTSAQFIRVKKVLVLAHQNLETKAYEMNDEQLVMQIQPKKQKQKKTADFCTNILEEE